MGQHKKTTTVGDVVSKLSSMNSSQKSVLVPVYRKAAGPAWKSSKTLVLTK